MKRKLLKICYCILYYIGIIPLFYKINNKKQLILVFHHIIPDRFNTGSFEQKIVCTSQSRFHELLKIINNRFEITNEIGKPGTAVITFDDGYRAALVADEELSKFGNHAIFFVPTCIPDAGPLWVDQIMLWFAYADNGSYYVGKDTINLGDQKSRQHEYSKFLNTLYESNTYSETVVDLLSQLNSQFKFNNLDIDKNYYNLRYKGLASSEISFLKNKGHKIGGHSTKHDILSLLSDEALKNDFDECASQIGKLYNSDIYAYPYGHSRDVSSKVVAQCEVSAFRYAVMNEYIYDSSDYLLSRINISHYESRYEIEAAMSGMIFWVKDILHRIYG